MLEPKYNYNVYKLFGDNLILTSTWPLVDFYDAASEIDFTDADIKTLSISGTIFLINK